MHSSSHRGLAGFDAILIPLSLHAVRTRIHCLIGTLSSITDSPACFPLRLQPREDARFQQGTTDSKPQPCSCWHNLNIFCHSNFFMHVYVKTEDMNLCVLFRQLCDLPCMRFPILIASTTRAFKGSPQTHPRHLTYPRSQLQHSNLTSFIRESLDLAVTASFRLEPWFLSSALMTTYTSHVPCIKGLLTCYPASHSCYAPLRQPQLCYLVTRYLPLPQLSSTAGVKQGTVVVASLRYVKGLVRWPLLVSAHWSRPFLIGQTNENMLSSPLNLLYSMR